MSRNDRIAISSDKRSKQSDSIDDGELRSERIWTASGVALACFALVGALILIQTNDGVPRVFGGEHLALFSKPVRSRDVEIELPIAAGAPLRMRRRSRRRR